MELERDVIISQWIAGTLLQLLLQFKWDFAYLLHHFWTWHGTPFRLQIKPISQEW